MLMQEGVVLGHYISAIGIQVDPAKIEVIQTLPIPTKLKDIRSFLGHAGYYRHFIKDFSKIANPLYKLLTKEAEFNWTPKCDEAFLQLKKLLTTTPILQGPNWNLPFHIYTNAQILAQKHSNPENGIYYISKNTNNNPLECCRSITKTKW